MCLVPVFANGDIHDQPDFELGDAKFLLDGVSELRIDWGPGYRVYFGRDDRTVIVLVCGGDKRKQGVDIKRAVELWQEYGNRKRRGPRAKR